MDKRQKLLSALALVFLLNIALIALAQTAPDAFADSWRRGSSGETVKKIQRRLSDWGYYSGAVDGVYGARTEEAVKKFQKKNGLTADGVAGP